MKLKSLSLLAVTLALLQSSLASAFFFCFNWGGGSNNQPSGFPMLPPMPSPQAFMPGGMPAMPSSMPMQSPMPLMSAQPRHQQYFVSPAPTRFAPMAVQAPVVELMPEVPQVIPKSVEPSLDEPIPGPWIKLPR